LFPVKGVAAVATLVRARGLPWPQRLTLGFGVLMTLLGLGGFAVAGFGDFTGAGEHYLLGLRLNPLQALIYLATGALASTTGWGLRSTRVFGFCTGIVYLVVFALGAPAAEVAGTGPLNANTAATVLHMLLGFTGVAIAQGATWCERCRRKA
jgi:hypothetical protein